MRWVTRQGAKVDRIACPWLIRKFVDPGAEFLFVPAEEVMRVAEEQGAIPFDVPGVELTHRGDRCSFDAIMAKYDLRDPALEELARIVRAADTRRPDLAPEAAGLEAIAEGFRRVSRDDADNMAKQFPLYDALYAYCKLKAGAGRGP